MAENFFKYTSLTYDDITKQMSDRLNSDTRFDNPRESAIFQTILEVFAGSTDITNYYLQRRAEECYFDTAQLKSSIILLARQLGYVVTRPQSARANVQLKLKGDFTGVFDTTQGADNKIQIPYYSKFSTNGNDFVLVDTFTYNIPTSVLTDMLTDTNDFELDITTDSFDNNIDIVQGEIKEIVIAGAKNIQVGANFQIYRIEDKEFSNTYGSEDYFHNNVTQVYVGNEKSSDTLYEIDRRSLINWESLSTNDLSEASKVCLVRTTPDEYVEVLFGDDAFAAKGPVTKEDNVYVQYIATKGKAANKVGTIGDTVTHDGNVYTNVGVDISDKVKFTLLSNITGGADIEDNDSIKYSAPKIYYSLDRLVSKSDYINYLKTLKSPIEVKNAVAWGEQEERDKAGVFADIKMFNVGMFTVVGSLYNTDGEIYDVKTIETGLDDAVLDNDYSPDELQTQGYFNVYTRQAIAHQLKKYNVVSYHKTNLGNSTTDGAESSIISSFGNAATLTFEYRSDVTGNATNIYTTSAVVTDLSTLPSNASYVDIADAINTELVAFIDKRANAYDNANYNSVAFTNGSEDIMIYNEDDLRFECIYNTDTPCYVYNFTGSLADSLKLSNRTYTTVATTYQEDISGKITQVIDYLDERAQLNIKNIYVSPIIHNFNLEGTVYVKPLFDKETVKTEINNSIYSWLDINADFNVSIQLSNIMELISVHGGTVHSNVDLRPVDITAGVNNTENQYYFGIDDENVKPYYNSSLDKNEIDIVIKEALAPYLNNSSFEEILEYRRFYDDGESSTTSTLLESKEYYLNNTINERLFYNMFLKTLYDLLLEKSKNQPKPDNPKDGNEYVYKDAISTVANITNFRKFLGYTDSVSMFNSFNEYFSFDLTSDFAKVVNKIHKDLSYIIRLNLINSYGNIEAEYNNDDKFIRGGYTLDSEIVKISLANLNYEYK